MDISIGLRNNAREISGETELSAEALRQAMAEGTLIEVTDKDGAHFVVAGDSVAYLRLGDPKPRRVGFGI